MVCVVVAVAVDGTPAGCRRFPLDNTGVTTVSVLHVHELTGSHTLTVHATMGICAFYSMCQHLGRVLN